jgi:hypothetical protein
MKRLCALVLGAAALVAAQGCTSEEPALYLGGPPGPATQYKVSNASLTLMIGDSAEVGARAADAVGNATGDAVTLTACDANVATVASASAEPQWTTTAYLKAVGLGSSCVLVQAAGLTADTIKVVVGPVGVALSGPAALVSGAQGKYAVTFLGAAGDTLTGVVPLTWSTSSRATMVIGPVTADTGLATAQTPGTVLVQVQVAGGADATKSVTVSAGVFTGTVSATTGAPGTLITATRAADGPYWDTDTQVTLGTATLAADYMRPITFGRPDLGGTEIVFAIPATGATTAAALRFSNMGSGQLQQTAGTITPTVADVDLYQPGNITNNCTAPAAPPAFATVKSPGNSVYLVHRGSTLGAMGCQNGGTGYDHYILYRTGSASEAIDVAATWGVAGDNDIYICTTNFADCPGAGVSGNTLDELGAANVALAANTDYLIIFSPWTAGTGINNIKIKITKR